MRNSTRKRLFLLLLPVTFLVAVVSCRSNEDPTRDKTLTESSSQIYVGCRPSLGECRNSCSDQKGYGVEDDEKCPASLAEGSIACYCGQSTPLPEEPDSDAYAYIGCRHSPSECLNSCSNRAGIAQQHPLRCPASLGEGSYACYCRL